MAVTNPPPESSAEKSRELPSAVLPEIAKEGALIPVQPQFELNEMLALNPNVARLPVELDVAVQLKDFRIRNLLALGIGQVIETQWACGEDLPLAVRDTQLAWSEFEVIESRLAVRITRLA